MPVSPTNNSIGNPLIEIDTTPSTNNYAMELIHNGLAKHGMAVFAYEQTAGKGQRGRHWYSSRGENVILSVILNTSGLQVSSPFLLSMAAALAVHDFFSKYAGDENSVKWPNDLYWRDRKAGGILIENVIKGRDWQWAIAGIGININQTDFTANARNAVSLKQITGKHLNPLELTKELCACFEERYLQLLNKRSQTIIEAYNNVLYKKGQQITLKKNSAVFNCTVKGVNAYGQLITDAATEQLFEVGEVQWII